MAEVTSPDIREAVRERYAAAARRTGGAPPDRSSRRRALASHVTRPAPYSRVAMASTFAVRDRSSS